MCILYLFARFEQKSIVKMPRRRKKWTDITLLSPPAFDLNCSASPMNGYVFPMPGTGFSSFQVCR